MGGNLAKRIGHDFSDPSLLEAALRHRSLGARHNERLEFLGDSVLGLAISEMLFAKYPSASEGELTQLRARLVRQATLATVARSIDLGHALQLGPSAGRSGGSDRTSILADALEAIIAAIFLDAGFEEAKIATLGLFKDEILKLDSETIEKDPKTQLQELLQSQGNCPPSYEVVSTSGQPHQREFTVHCRFDTPESITDGRGASRKSAEQEAASKALEKIRKE
ncbi:MAG: ribonuclease III [Acidiferrobacteraceae bacterium]|nr:ribonuclease III [Acidiferrobacteraceae bacterium]